MPPDQAPINLTIGGSSPNDSSNSTRTFFQHDTMKMGRYAGGGFLFLLLSLVPRLRADSRVNQMIRSPSDFGANQINGREDDDSVGTRWAVFIAGTSDYGNYIHQKGAPSVRLEKGTLPSEV